MGCGGGRCCGGIVYVDEVMVCCKSVGGAIGLSSTSCGGKVGIPRGAVVYEGSTRTSTALFCTGTAFGIKRDLSCLLSPRLRRKASFICCVVRVCLTFVLPIATSVGCTAGAISGIAK